MRIFVCFTAALLIIASVTSPCLADLSEVKVYLGEKFLRDSNFLKAKEAFKEAIEINFANDRAWKGYEQSVIELYKLKITNQEMILEPRFDITYDDVKIYPLGRFGKKAVTIRGKVKNMSDIGFDNVEIVITFMNEEGKMIKEYGTFLKNIDPKEQKPFSFTVITDEFKEYRVEVHNR